MIYFDKFQFWLHLKLQALAHHWPQTLTLGELIPLLFLSLAINFGVFAGSPLFARFRKAPVWIDKKKSYCLPGDRIWPHLLWALVLGALLQWADWWKHRLAMPLIAFNALLLILAVLLHSLPLHLGGVMIYLLIAVVIPLSGLVKMALLLPTIDLELARLNAAGR